MPPSTAPTLLELLAKSTQVDSDPEVVPAGAAEAHRNERIRASARGTGLVVVGVHSDAELRPLAPLLGDRAVHVVTDNLELTPPAGVTLHRLADLPAAESFLIDLDPDAPYALAIRTEGDRSEVLLREDPIDALMALEGTVERALRQDPILGGELEKVLVDLLERQAERFFPNGDAITTGAYLGILRRLAERRDDREERDALVSKRFSSLSKRIASALRVTPVERETLHQALKLLDLNPSSTLISAYPKTLYPELVGELTRTVIYRDRPVGDQGCDRVPIAARIMRAAQDYLREDGGSDTLRKLKKRVDSHYGRDVFMALSQEVRQNEIDYTPPGLSGEVTGEELFGVLQITQTMSRTGTMVFESVADQRRVRGWLAIDKGEVRGIETETESGVDALLDMFTWSAGKFFLYDVESVMLDEIDTPTSKLLIQGAKYLDDLRELQKRGFTLVSLVEARRDGEPDEYAGLYRAIRKAGAVPFPTMLERGLKKMQLISALATLAHGEWIRFRAPEGV